VSQSQQLSLQDALRQAVTFHQAGHLQDAEHWYRAILQSVPLHPDANHNLGLLLQLSGKAGADLPHLKAAYMAMPDNPHFALSYAAALQVDDPEQSLQVLRGTIDRGVVSAEIWCNLANLLRAKRDVDGAKTALHAALDLRPTYAIAYFNLGLIEQDCGQHKAAAANYRHAIEHQSTFAQAHNNLGMVLREQGDTRAAIEQFNIALIIDPQYAQAAYNRGQACAELGMPEQALANFIWAVTVLPDFVLAHNEAGLLILTFGDAVSAASHFEMALDVQPDFVAARVNLVNALMTMQQWGQALKQARQAIAGNPDCAAAYHNLGTIQRHFNDFVSAEVAYREALAIDSAFVDAMLGLASVIRYQRADETIQLCLRAQELKPDFAASYVLLAECWAAQGRFAEAEMELRRAIVAEPTRPEAWSAIPSLRKMTRADMRWLTNAQALANSGLSSEQETFLRFALGKAFDDLGEYADAFRQFRTANELAKQNLPPYNRDEQEQRVQMICDAYSRDWMEAPRTNRVDSSRPVFVIGMPRSGTSLVEQILSAHPMVAGAGELSYWNNASAQFFPYSTGGNAHRLPAEQELFALGNDYLAQLSSYDADAQRVVDKMPANFRCVGLIHAALPNARIVHVQRNPVDTCLSIYFQHFESYHNYANDLEDLAHFYRLYRRLMSHWTSILPKESILHLSYESLAQDQETETRKLLDFVGLPWDASCLQFQNVERRVGTASNWQVRQALNRRSVERWRHYQSDLEVLLPLLDEVNS